jgi:protein transport protein SEC24
MDHAMYHSLGMGQHDPNDPNSQYNQSNQAAPNQFQPPVAPNPYQQQQQQQFPPQQGTSQGQQYYGTPGGPSPQPTQGYFQGQPQAQADSNDITAQMAGMSLGAEGHQVGTGKRKKKDRHAYHQVESAGSSQAFNGIPPAGTPATAFLNADPSGATGFTGQPAFSPQPGQGHFPAPSSPYAPGGATSPAELGARNGSTEAAVAAGGQNKVSQDELPSVPAARDAAQQHYLTNIYPTFEKHVPPPASVSFVAFDQGNSSPKFARLTMNNIPATSEALHTTGLPLGLVLQPLARAQAGEAEVPVLDFGDIGPPRCRRCRAYINPFMMFRSGGNRFVCNLCTYPNDTPPEYFCATSPQGIRVDRDQRPELCRGTVEFVCPKEYYNREPVGLRWLFVIDVTQEAYNKGYLEAFCDGILATLYGAGEAEEKDENGEPKRRIPPNSRVGFVTYDKEVHFYNCSVSFRGPFPVLEADCQSQAALEQAQMMIMPDIEDPFVPLSDGLFVDPVESKYEHWHG